MTEFSIFVGEVPCVVSVAPQLSGERDSLEAAAEDIQCKHLCTELTLKGISLLGLTLLSAEEQCSQTSKHQEH